MEMSSFKNLLLVVVGIFLIAEPAVSQNSERMERRRRMKLRHPGSDMANLKVGQAAPLFELKSLDNQSSTRLKSFRGKCPVILLFGSYT